MKKLLISLFVMALYANVSAQDNTGDLNMLKEGTVIRYTLDQTQRLGIQYHFVYQMDVTDVDEKSYGKTIKYRLSGYDVRKKGLVPFGYKSPIVQSIDVYADSIGINGELILNSLWRPQVTANSYSSFGYALTIPKNLKVGKQIKSDFLITQVIYPEGQFADPGGKDMVQYSNFRVTAEEDVVTNAGTFHCYKIEGSALFYYGYTSTQIPTDSYQLWFSPNVGIVKMDVQFHYTTLRVRNELTIDEIIFAE